MTDQKQQSRRKWVIIPVHVNGKGMYDINYKMPANVASCDGFMFSVVQRIADRDIKRIGELSIEFNSRKVHPLHLMLDYMANNLAPKKEPLSLDESLQQCSQIGGFYRDYSDKQYTLNIYLACRTKTENP